MTPAEQEYEDYFQQRDDLRALYFRSRPRSFDFTPLLMAAAPAIAVLGALLFILWSAR